MTATTVQHSTTEELQVFNFNGMSLRAKLIDGEPWFILVDACKALELSSPHKVANSLDEDDRNTIPVIDSIGREQSTWAVNESGLYQIIFQSRKQEAKAFKKWVTSEVLPAIRKTGSYGATPVLPQSYEQALEKLLETVRANNALEAKVKQDAPKVQYVDTFVHSGDLMTFRDLSNHLGVKESQIREDLVARKWIYKHTNTRWSFKRLAHVNEYQWRAYAGFKKYFRLTAAPDAPRFGNEVRQTLKVTPAGQVAIARMYGFRADEQKAVA